jgi:hypothetical protein
MILTADLEAIRRNMMRSYTFLIAPLVFGLLAKQATAQALPHDIVKHIDGPRVVVPAARSQPCDADSCADRRTLSVTLPVGAKYLGTHYFTNANYPNDLADVRDTGPVEVAFARFSQEVHYFNEENRIVVTVYYYNRANRPRTVAISVDYE